MGLARILTTSPVFKVYLADKWLISRPWMANQVAMESQMPRRLSMGGVSLNQRSCVRVQRLRERA